MTDTTSLNLNQTLAVIHQHAPNFHARLGLILGSGLGDLAEQIEHAIVIPYEVLPHFPISTVAGHAGRLVLGYINKMPVACLQGRVHLYEGVPSSNVKALIRALKLIGCQDLIITNAAGSLRPDVGPGDLMLINDHINFQYTNPLIGPNDEEFGPRFFPMDNAYDSSLRQRIAKIAQQLDIALPQGVYIATAGPCFETPAEIRAFRIMGADAVGMSTVPEVLVARHCGLRVLVISAITNFAAGMSQESITHEGTLQGAALTSNKLNPLLLSFIGSLHHEPC